MATEYNAETLTSMLNSAVAALKEAIENPKPSYSIDGQSVSWDAYRQSLNEQIAFLREQIKEAEDIVEEETYYGD